MSTTYILLSSEDIADLSDGKEVYCSLDDNKTFALMSEQSFKDTYLKTENA